MSSSARMVSWAIWPCRVAVLFTKAYGRILGPGLAALDPQLPLALARRSPLALAWKDLLRQLDQFIDHGLAPA